LVVRDVFLVFGNVPAIGLVTFFAIFAVVAQITAVFGQVLLVLSQVTRVLVAVRPVLGQVLLVLIDVFAICLQILLVILQVCAIVLHVGIAAGAGGLSQHGCPQAQHGQGQQMYKLSSHNRTVSFQTSPSRVDAVWVVTTQETANSFELDSAVV